MKLYHRLLHITLTLIFSIESMPAGITPYRHVCSDDTLRPAATSVTSVKEGATAPGIAAAIKPRSRAYTRLLEKLKEHLMQDIDLFFLRDDITPHEKCDITCRDDLRNYLDDGYTDDEKEAILDDFPAKALLLDVIIRLEDHADMFGLIDAAGLTAEERDHLIKDLAQEIERYEEMADRLYRIRSQLAKEQDAHEREKLKQEEMTLLSRWRTIKRSCDPDEPRLVEVHNVPGAKRGRTLRVHMSDLVHHFVHGFLITARLDLRLKKAISEYIPERSSVPNARAAIELLLRFYGKDMDTEAVEMVIRLLRYRSHESPRFMPALEYILGTVRNRARDRRSFLDTQRHLQEDRNSLQKRWAVLRAKILTEELGPLKDKIESIWRDEETAASQKMQADAVYVHNHAQRRESVLSEIVKAIVSIPDLPSIFEYLRAERLRIASSIDHIDPKKGLKTTEHRLKAAGVLLEELDRKCRQFESRDAFSQLCQDMLSETESLARFAYELYQLFKSTAKHLDTSSKMQTNEGIETILLARKEMCREELRITQDEQVRLKKTFFSPNRGQMAELATTGSRGTRTLEVINDEIDTIDYLLRLSMPTEMAQTFNIFENLNGREIKSNTGEVYRLRLSTRPWELAEQKHAHSVYVQGEDSNPDEVSQGTGSVIQDEAGRKKVTIVESLAPDQLSDEDRRDEISRVERGIMSQWPDAGACVLLLEKVDKQDPAMGAAPAARERVRGVYWWSRVYEDGNISIEFVNFSTLGGQGMMQQASQMIGNELRRLNKPVEVQLHIEETRSLIDLAKLFGDAEWQPQSAEGQQAMDVLAEGLRNKRYERSVGKASGPEHDEDVAELIDNLYTVITEYMEYCMTVHRGDCPSQCPLAQINLRKIFWGWILAERMGLIDLRLTPIEIQHRTRVLRLSAKVRVETIAELEDAPVAPWFSRLLDSVNPVRLVRSRAHHAAQVARKNLMQRFIKILTGDF